MSVLEQTSVSSHLDFAQPGSIVLRGDRIVAPMLFGDKVLWFEDRNELISMIVTGQRLLRAMDDAVRERLASESIPAPGSGPMGRPYVPVPVPRGQEAPEYHGAHASALAQTGAVDGEEAVVPGPSLAAAAP